MRIWQSLKANTGKVFSALGRGLGNYSPNLMLAVGGLMMATFMALLFAYLIIYVVPGEDPSVLIAKIDKVGWALLMCIGIMALGIIGLFIQARLLGGVRANVGGSGFEVSAPGTPLTEQQQDPCVPDLGAGGPL